MKYYVNNAKSRLAILIDDSLYKPNKFNTYSLAEQQKIPSKFPSKRTKVFYFVNSIAFQTQKPGMVITNTIRLWVGLFRIDLELNNNVKSFKEL